MKILEGQGSADPPKLKRNQKLLLHTAGCRIVPVTYKRLFEHHWDRPYYIYVTTPDKAVKLVDIRDCEIVP